MSQCSACLNDLPASKAVFTVSQFGALGEPVVATYALCSAECLRDLGIDLRIKAAVQ